MRFAGAISVVKVIELKFLLQVLVATHATVTATSFSEGVVEEVEVELRGMLMLLTIVVTLKGMPPRVSV